MNAPLHANKEILEAIRVQHPEWIDVQGDCAPCDRLLHELDDPSQALNQTEK